MFIKGIVINTPRILNKILIIAISIIGLVFNAFVIYVNKDVNGFKKITKKAVVMILKKIEKWASFLLSLFEEKSVIKASKLVPILAPNIRGIAWIVVIILDIASIWSMAINRLDDWSVAVNKTPITRLKKKLSVVFFIYSKMIGLSFNGDTEIEIKKKE